MLAFWLGMTKFDYDEVKPGYYDRVFLKRQGPQSKWHWLKFAFLQQYVPDGARLLDIGCGPGTFIGLLPRAVEATGVDIAQPQVEYANRHYAGPTKKFMVGQPGPLPFPDGSFDVVSIIELVEHLPDDVIRTLLAEARRLLRPGSGILLVSTPNYRSLWPVLEYFVNRLSALSYEDQHINHFHMRRFQSLLAESRFRQIRVRRYQGFAPFAAAISWRLSDWLDRIENFTLSRIYGFLLVATARPG